MNAISLGPRPGWQTVREGCRAAAVSNCGLFTSLDPAQQVRLQNLGIAAQYADS